MAKKKYYRNGNPEHYTYFDSEMFDSFTEDQKKNWVSADDIEEHPVPDEVKNFMEQPKIRPDDDIARIERPEQSEQEIPADPGTVEHIKAATKIIKEFTYPDDPKEKREFLKSELIKLNIEFDKRLSTKRLAKLYEDEIAKQKDE